MPSIEKCVYFLYVCMAVYVQIIQSVLPPFLPPLPPSLPPSLPTQAKDAGRRPHRPKQHDVFLLIRRKNLV